MEIRLKEPQRYRALLVDPVAGREQFIESLMEDRGFVVVGKFESLRQLAEQDDRPEANLVIVYTEAIDDGLCDGLSELRAAEPTPVLLISEQDDPAAIARAIGAGADTFMPIGVAADRFRSAAYSAMATFSQIASAREEASSARRELDDRKVIERAKGILMDQRGISESEAFREIQQSSMHRNLPMPHVARSIIEAKELLG
jgi:response regulator NasT